MGEYRVVGSGTVWQSESGLLRPYGSGNFETKMIWSRGPEIALGVCHEKRRRFDKDINTGLRRHNRWRGDHVVFAAGVWN